MHRAMISPSMMCAPQWQDVRPLLDQMLAGGVEMLHIDIMDGHFVPNMMLGTACVRELRKLSHIPLDLHFMVERPEDRIAWFDIQPGEWVSVHAESTCHLQRVLARVRDLGARPLVALNPATPLAAIENVLPDVDGVMLMTVNPGYAGQKLIPQMLDKIARTRRMLDAAGLFDLRIEVDGNVSFENVGAMHAAGADIFVCGTASLFNSQGTFVENLARLRGCVSNVEKEGWSA